MVNKDTWEATDLIWRIPIIILHWFWSYIIIPRASSVNPFPWVSSLIMALFHQHFTVLTTWDNNLIASQSQRERWPKRPLEIDVCSSVEHVHNQRRGVPYGNPFGGCGSKLSGWTQRSTPITPHQSFLENTGHYKKVAWDLSGWHKR